MDLQVLNMLSGAAGAIAAGLITWYGLPRQIWRVHKRRSIEGIEPSIIVLATLSYSFFTLFGLTATTTIWPLVIGYAPGGIFGVWLIILMAKYWSTRKRVQA